MVEPVIVLRPVWIKTAIHKIIREYKTGGVNEARPRVTLSVPETRELNKRDTAAANMMEIIAMIWYEEICLSPL